jgi:hypothetical protein
VPPVSGNYRGTLERTMEVEVKITALGDDGGNYQFQKQVNNKSSEQPSE